MEEPAEKGGERTAPAETVAAAAAARDAHTPRLFYSIRSAECKAQHATKPPSAAAAGRISPSIGVEAEQKS